MSPKLETLNIYKDVSQNRLQLLMWNTFIFLNKDDDIAGMWSCETEDDTKLSGPSSNPHSGIGTGSEVREIKC